MPSMNGTFAAAAVALLLAGFFVATSADEQTGLCIKLGYVGPVGEVIDRKPTKLALASDDAALATLAEVGSVVTEQIPIVGKFLSFTFDALANFFEGDVIEEMYDSLFSEIQAVRQYVDQNIRVVNLQYVKDMFGTKEGGIFGIALYCRNTFTGQAEEMDRCLETLRTTLIQQYHFFMPDDDDVELNELTLPLFREYGQLFVQTLLEQINVAKQKGKDSIAVAHTKELIRKIEAFREHAMNAIKQILKDQVTAWSDEHWVGAFNWEIRISDFTIKHEIRFRISTDRNPFTRRILSNNGKSEIRILKSKSGFPNRKHPSVAKRSIWTGNARFHSEIIQQL